MAQLKNGTMVVVTDSEKALFLVNTTDGEDPNLELIRKEEEENPADRDQKANRRGRNQDNGPGQKSAFDDTDFHELQKDRFAADLSDKLYRMAHKGRFSSLVLVASPQVLGVLRDAMHKEVAGKVIAEIPKTLTNHPVDRIETLVKHDLAEMTGAA